LESKNIGKRLGELYSEENRSEKNRARKAVSFHKVLNLSKKSSLEVSATTSYSRDIGGKSFKLNEC